MRLAAGCCLYEKSLPNVKRCVESIKNHVDYIFAIDGRFDHFPDHSLLSSPEIRSYLSSIENVVLDDHPGPEVSKRQRYCELCRQHQCEFLLIIDSDEYVMEHGDWGRFKDNLSKLGDDRNIYGVRFAYAVPVHADTTPYPRLWWNPWEVSYVKHNLWQTQRQGSVRSTSECPVVEGITMAGDNNLVSREYIDKGIQYQTWLLKQENPVEKTWQELFHEADLDTKLELFLNNGGSGQSTTNTLISGIVAQLLGKVNC
jgi:hypothetical protein